MTQILRFDSSLHQVEKAQQECKELLVVIVSERRVADDQEKAVTAEADKIGKEEV